MYPMGKPHQVGPTMGITHYVYPPWEVPNGKAPLGRTHHGNTPPGTHHTWELPKGKAPPGRTHSTRHNHHGHSNIRSTQIGCFKLSDRLKRIVTETQCSHRHILISSQENNISQRDSRAVLFHVQSRLQLGANHQARQIPLGEVIFLGRKQYVSW